ncbi:MAG: ferrous iron transport protein A [Clostridia bacterium]|nr:ferrous iron transport protein A [Clostridia bacterium]
MTLDNLSKNKRAVIIGFNIADKNVLKRLYDIGLRINGEIIIVKKNKKGSHIISTDGRIMALSYEIVCRILIKE